MLSFCILYHLSSEIVPQFSSLHFLNSVNSVNSEQCELKHENPKKKRNIKIECFPRANMIKLEISDKNKLEILRHFHEELGHLGITKMTELIRKTYNWNGLQGDVKNYVNSCSACAQRKKSSHQNRQDLKITASKPLEKIMLDIAGPLTSSKNGYQYVLGIVDVYSRFLMLIPIRSISSRSILNIIQTRWIPMFGVPELFITDGARNLNSKLVEDLSLEYGMQKLTCSPYHSNSNGIIERSFQTVKDMIYATVSSHGGDWVDTLPIIEIGLRSAIHSTIRVSPYEVIFGRLPNLPQFIPQNLKFENLNAEEYMKKLEKRRLEINTMLKDINMQNEIKMKSLYKAGDFVMVKSVDNQRKGIDKPKYIGPAIVHKILGIKSYVVRLNGNYLKRHEDHLKRYETRKLNYSKTEPKEQKTSNSKNVKEERYPKRYTSNKVQRYGFD